ncbi:MAG TPA: hypothetical protein VF008_17030, partial [Niastella sp.]
MRIHIHFIVICSLVCQTNLAQTSYTMKVARDRELWHGNIDKQQKKAIQVNSQGRVSADTTISLHVMDALIRGVDELQNQIEMDSTLNGNGKIKYLRSVDFLLQSYLSNLNRRDYPASLAPALIKAFTQCMVLDKQRKSIAPVIEANDYGVGKILMDCLKYSDDNPGLASARTMLMRKYLTMHPDQIMP